MGREVEVTGTLARTTTRTGKRGLGLSIWDFALNAARTARSNRETEEAAEAHAPTGQYSEHLARFAAIFRAPPGRGRYAVLVADQISKWLVLQYANLQLM